MNKCILYIEDDDMQIALTKLCLTRESYRFDIEFAETGQAGITAFDPEKHSLVIIDYNLPDMNAPEIAKALLAICSPLPIVFFSSLFMNEHLSTAKSLDVMACITKEDIQQNLKQIAALI